MALIKCGECGKEISDKATTCIHCGCPIEEKENKIICSFCGKVLSDDARTCPNCGKILWGKKDKTWSNIVCICAIITSIFWFICAYRVDLDRSHFSYQVTFIIIGILNILFGFWYMYYYHKKANEYDKDLLSRFIKEYKTLIIIICIVLAILFIMICLPGRRNKANIEMYVQKNIIETKKE